MLAGTPGSLVSHLCPMKTTLSVLRQFLLQLADPGIVFWGRWWLSCSYPCPVVLSIAWRVSQNQRPSCNLHVWRPYTEEQMPHVPSAFCMMIRMLNIWSLVPTFFRKFISTSASSSTAVFCILLSKTLKRILLAWMMSAIVRCSSQRTVPLTFGTATKTERFQL